LALLSVSILDGAHALTCIEVPLSTLKNNNKPAQLSTHNRAGETFVPVCLPGFNATAFVHAYVSCLDEEQGVFLALVAGSGDAFHRLAGGWLCCVL